MPIDSSKFNNPILKRVAEGDISILNDINENSTNISEYILCHGTFNPLTIAAENGHIEIAKRLLAKKDDGSYEFPAVIQNIAANNNHVMCFAAGRGHFAVVERLLAKNDDGSYEFPAVIQNIAADDNFTLRFAAFYGYIDVVKKLLAKNSDGSYEFPAVIQNIEAGSNFALRFSAERGRFEVVERLLAKKVDSSYEFLDVIQNIAADNNYALRLAAENGHIAVVKKLLTKNGDGTYEFLGVIQNIAAEDNYALVRAAQNGHYEISYMLAKIKWPNGVKGIRQNLRGYFPIAEIRKGEIIVNSREDSFKEVSQLFKWLQEGYIPTSVKDLYLPPEISSRKAKKTTTMSFDVMNIIKEYAGTQRSIDTSRPTKEELNRISGRGVNLLKSSSTIMNHLEKARIEREENEHSCNEQAIIPYRLLGFN